jgi:NADH-quinone oxidoreductase subunit L
MAIVLVLTGIIIAFAYSQYVKMNRVPAEPGSLRGFAKVLYHKYYIDEIYNQIITQPVTKFSKFSDKVIENVAIDGIVNSIGQSVTGASRIFRRIQTGRIGFYIFVMVISIIILLTMTIQKL